MFDPCDPDLPAGAVSRLGSGLAGYAVADHGRQVVLRDGLGASLVLEAVGRDLMAKFEVFTLRAVVAPDLGPDPPTFHPWPFRSWRMAVLRRVEWIAGRPYDDPALLGRQAIAQRACRRVEDVPAEAVACCEVAVGLLFAGEDRGRLLVACDWSPFTLVVSRDEADIDRFMADCRETPLPPAR